MPLTPKDDHLLLKLLTLKFLLLLPTVFQRLSLLTVSLLEVSAQYVALSDRQRNQLTEFSHAPLATS